MEQISAQQHSRNCLLHCLFFISRKIKINWETAPECPASKGHGTQLSGAQTARCPVVWRPNGTVPSWHPNGTAPSCLAPKRHGAQLSGAQTAQHQVVWRPNSTAPSCLAPKRHGAQLFGVQTARRPVFWRPKGTAPSCLAPNRRCPNGPPPTIPYTANWC